MADYWSRREKLFQGLRGLPPQAKMLAQSLTSRSAPIVPLPRRLSIVLYPTYSYKLPNRGGLYGVAVRGWLYSPGDMRSKRARLVLRTAERLVGSAGAASEPELEQEVIRLIDDLEVPGSESESGSETSSLAAFSAAVSSDPAPRRQSEQHISDAPGASTLVARLEPTFRKGAPNQRVQIHVRPREGETQDPRTIEVVTDESGRFEVTAKVPFIPGTVVASHVVQEDGPSTRISPLFIPDSGVSVISDVDDTLRLTGIRKGKRETMRNVFSRTYDQCKLEGVADWYQRLSRAGMSFHYVSNSPWQLYDLIRGFLSHHDFPAGSIHLKYYQGLLDGLFEPVVSRKKATLERILLDFPHRKFILIGDSGELDLEAYVSLANKFPDQVLAIYIRDITLPGTENLAIYDAFEPKEPAPCEEPADLIDLSSAPAGAKKSAPPVPPKPTHLRDHVACRRSHRSLPTSEHSCLRHAVRDSNKGAPTGGVGGVVFAASNLATATAAAASAAAGLSKDSAGDHNDQGGAPPSRSNSNLRTHPSFVTSAQDYADYERLDKDVEGWKTRVDVAHRSLPENVALKMWRHPRDVELESVSHGKKPARDLLG